MTSWSIWVFDPGPFHVEGKRQGTSVSVSQTQLRFYEECAPGTNKAEAVARAAKLAATQGGMFIARMKDVDGKWEEVSPELMSSGIARVQARLGDAAQTAATKRRQRKLRDGRGQP